ncbi:hypothetical protein TRVL_08822 [Trypanosoma vivax]|nr:hypothetical protein TRVL_08822 [Trypanosoma vivax]
MRGRSELSRITERNLLLPDGGSAEPLFMCSTTLACSVPAQCCWPELRTALSSQRFAGKMRLRALRSMPATASHQRVLQLRRQQRSNNLQNAAGSRIGYRQRPPQSRTCTTPTFFYKLGPWRHKYAFKLTRRCAKMNGFVHVIAPGSERCPFEQRVNTLNHHRAA